ncbi:MAG: type I-E CRISPR-associated protein Cse2/CasB [Anaerolineaceae bacterium]|nr:type I-E CRISPR-associated protein Cse2/CasB [Anaerolineaceae bacterium]
MIKPPYEHPFVSYLLTQIAGDRAARAALRRSLGRAPGEAPDAFRYVVPWLPDPCSQRVEASYYLIAGLFALHPKYIDEGNLAAHLRKLAGADEEENQRLERRLMAALRAHPNDLPNHLRRLVGILKAKDVPVNWHELMRDLLAWDHPERSAQKRWANAFWGGRLAAAADHPDPGIQPVEIQPEFDDDKE